MEFEKLQEIIAEVMNVSEEEIRPETTCVKENNDVRRNERDDRRTVKL